MIQVVVELVAVLGVDAINFLTASNASKEAYKSATLLKSLKINVIILGEHGVGKLTLAKYILPNATVVDASQNEKVFQLLETNSELIIRHLEQSPNLQLLLNKIELLNVRVVVTSTAAQLKEHFGMQITLPPLKEREEDIEILVKKFQKDASEFYGKEIEESTFEPDISSNGYSLKQQVYFHALVNDVSEKNLIHLIENYLFNKLGSNSDYSKFLPLYEVPLIRAGLKRFKSQLKLSERLGLNRNTLRKKIQENKEYLDE